MWKKVYISIFRSIFFPEIYHVKQELKSSNDDSKSSLSSSQCWAIANLIHNDYYHIDIMRWKRRGSMLKEKINQFAIFTHVGFLRTSMPLNFSVVILLARAKSTCLHVLGLHISSFIWFTLIFKMIVFVDITYCVGMCAVNNVNNQY